MYKNILAFWGILTLSVISQAMGGLGKNSKAVKDSIVKFGVDLEPYLLEYSKSDKVLAEFNYAPCINKVLKDHKYVKFPSYEITIGIDSSLGNNNKNHLKINSGNRIYFPKGSALRCPTELKTNGYMIFMDNSVRDVYLFGITVIGAKANTEYATSPYGAGIALYAPTNIYIENATVKHSTGDGITVRTNWGKQSEKIEFNDIKVLNSTRVGLLITGIIDGYFKNIRIEDTGELIKEKILKPQSALSFEPNDCTSKYINCRIENLNTRNNYGPVLGTANFSNIVANSKCDTNKVTISINNWKDFIDDPNCYGATLDISTFNVKNLQAKYESTKLSGTFTIINPIFERNTRKGNFDRYFILGKDEELSGGVKYHIENLKLISQGEKFIYGRRLKNESIKNLMTDSKKVIFRE